jgi:6-phospho-beta-glucosidase
MWDYWYDIKPELFFDHVGPDTASNFFNSFREDIRLMKSIGLNSVRTSIQWSRLIDDLETTTLNEDGVRFYNEVIDTFIEEGVRPVMNLCHFDLPIELYEKYGGWESKKVGDLYADFAEKCFELYSDRVKDWFTFNEPMVIVEGGYLMKFHYPEKVDGPLAVQVAYNIALASAKAIARFRNVAADDARVGIILNLTPPYPATDSEEDRKASHIANLWKNRLFMDSSVHGAFPTELVELLESEGVLWDATAEELKIIADNTIDVLGVNFYHPDRVSRPEFSTNSLAIDWMPDKFWKEYEMPGRRMNHDKGWEIYPKAVYDIAMEVKENYNNIPWFMSENGMGVSREERWLDAETNVINDDYRIQFIQEHLFWLHKGIEEGSNCFGYHLWTPIDCWSWLNAYRNRYGFISNNIHTQVKTVKKSGHWFKEVADTNTVDVTIEVEEKDNYTKITGL